MSCCDNKKEISKESKEFGLKCPVMGSPVDKKTANEKGLVREYKGKKYYFCCDGCPQKFEKDPESFIEKTTTVEENDCC